MEDKAAFEVQGSARIFKESNGEIIETKTTPWIKLSTAFRETLLRELKGSQLSIFLCLALHIDDINRSYPSIEKISSETGFSDRQVTRAIKELESRGWIEIEREEGKVNTYKLAPIVSFGKTTPQYVTPDKMSSPTSKVTPDMDVTPTPDSHVTPPLTMSPLTMSDEEESLRRNSKEEPKKKKGVRPPAVELCKRIVFRYPHKSIWKTIDHQIGSEFMSLLKWGRILRKWKLSGFNITNYKGMLDVFSNGWHEKQERKKSGFEIVKEMLNAEQRRSSDHGNPGPIDSDLPQLEARTGGGETIFDDPLGYE